jgi:Gnt-I system low-affinity gluconate transporter
MNYQLIFSVLAGIGTLLLLILYCRVPAFIALLITCIVTSLIAGMSGEKIINSIQEGMGSTLGFVARVIGLGAMFGAILEKSGGAVSIATSIMKKFGEKNTPLSLAITGIIIAIPVFFEVAFILLVPIIYAIQKKTGKSLLLYAIPLLSGLAFGHAFIPPTPGPIAVAGILGADIGWVILVGFFIGIPTVLISGLIFGKYISGKIYSTTPAEMEITSTYEKLPDFKAVFAIVILPIVLIFISTMVKSALIPITNSQLADFIALLGHPFSALIVANIVAWYVLGIRRGFTSNELLDISTKSMSSVGTIILVIGAGGAFKQVLVNTGAGKMLAESLSGMGIPVIVFAFIAASIIRILQGSATVAMITAASLVLPFLTNNHFSPIQLAALVASIAAGSSVLSHVNDGGFWMIKQYLGLTEKETFRSWTMMTTYLALIGFVFSVLVFYLF